MCNLMGIVREEHIIMVPWEVVHIVHVSKVKEVHLSLDVVGFASVGMLVIKSCQDKIVVQVTASLSRLLHWVRVERRVGQVDGSKRIDVVLRVKILGKVGSRMALINNLLFIHILAVLVNSNIFTDVVLLMVVLVMISGK